MKQLAALSSMIELSASHWTARRLARTSRNAYPGCQQVRILIVEFVPESAKGAFPRMARASLRPARSLVMVSAKSAMSWYQTQE